MGRPRIKTIDDGQLTAEVKTKKSRQRRGSPLAAKVKTSDKTKRAKVDEASRLSEEGEIRSESTSSDVHEQDRTGPAVAGSELEKQAQPSERSSKPQKPGKAKPRSKKYQEALKNLDRNKTYPLTEAIDMAKKLSYSKFNATLEAHINTAQTGIRGLVSLPYAKGKKRGLMPNPKNGTITGSSVEELKKAVEGFQAGKTEYKTEPKAPIIHTVMGKLDQPTEELSANIKTLLQTLGKTRVKKLTLSPTMGPSVKVDLASI